MKLQNFMKQAAVASLLLTTSLLADTASDIAELKKKIAQLEEKQQVLADETNSLQTGFNYTKVDTNASHSGLGAAASKVYYSKSPLSIGGYGEMYFSHTNKKTTTTDTTSNKVDVYRFVPYIGYKFTDNIILNTEIEFEHGGVTDNGKNEGGEVILEFMYLDFLVNNHLNFRVGNMLMPMGLINERHEPTLFTTVQRPTTDKNIIPTTWHESGVMIYGNITDGLSYKIAGVTALDNNQTGDKWLRDARGGSSTNDNVELGVVARVDFTGLNGLLLGASNYMDSDINIWDIHMDYKFQGFRAYGEYAKAHRSSSNFTNSTPTAPVDAVGGFINVGYDVLASTGFKYQMPIFFQYESVNPQDELANGTEGTKTTIKTVGLNFFPHDQVVLKADYAMQKKGNTDEDIFSLALGFIF